MCSTYPSTKKLITSNHIPLETVQPSSETSAGIIDSFEDMDLN